MKRRQYSKSLRILGSKNICGVLRSWGNQFCMPGNFEIKASKLKVVKGNFLQNQERRSAILPLYCLWPLTIKCTFIRLYFLHDIVVIVRRLKESFFQSDAMRKENDVTFFSFTQIRFTFTQPKVYFKLNSTLSAFMRY